MEWVNIEVIYISRYRHANRSGCVGIFKNESIELLETCEVVNNTATYTYPHTYPYPGLCNNYCVCKISQQFFIDNIRQQLQVVGYECMHISTMQA